MPAHHIGWWLAATLLVGACSSNPQLVADGGDGIVDAGPGSTADASDASGPPDAPAVEDLAQMCGGTAPGTALEWERCYAKRYCESHVFCSEHNLFASVQECIQLSDAISGGALGFAVAERVRAVADGRAAIDIGMFTTCLAELSPQRCSTAATAAACGLRYAGTIADAQPCYAAVECASPGARCEPQECGSTCCTGACTPKQKLGEVCNDFGACEPGLVCSVANKTCVTGDAGSTCSRYECDPAGWCSSGTCVADRATGETCSSLLECGGETVCVGLKRPVGPPRCQRVTVAGDACDWFCLGNLYCDLSKPQGHGVCRPLPAVGQPCSDLSPCQGASLRCSDGICAARPTAGQPCTDGACAPGLFCTDQLGAASPTCQAPFADGQSGCKQHSQCASYLCAGNQATAGQCLERRSTCP